MKSISFNFDQVEFHILFATLKKVGHQWARPVRDLNVHWGAKSGTLTRADRVPYWSTLYFCLKICNVGQNDIRIVCNIIITPKEKYPAVEICSVLNQHKLTMMSEAYLTQGKILPLKNMYY